MIGLSSIVIDMGTTNCKMSLYQIDSLKLIKEEKFRTPKINHGIFTDYDAGALWDNLKNGIKELSKYAGGNIDKIIFASVGEMGVIVNSEGEVCGPMIAWNDPRGADYINDMSLAQINRIHQISGLPAHSNYSVAKIKWLEKNCIKNWEKGMSWLNLPNYIAYLMTGIRQTEYTLASRTMALDLSTGEWSEELIKIFELPLDLFPAIVQGAESECRITEKMATLLGLSKSTKVFVAGHDHMVGSLAVNLQPGEFLNSTGTTEGLLCLYKENPIGNKEIAVKLSGGRYVYSDNFTIYGSLPAAGLAFEHFQKVYDYSYERLNEELENLYIDYMNDKLDIKHSLLFIPHLKGSGCPDKNINAYGMLYGMTEQVKSRDYLYAIVQGLCLELKQLCSLYQNHASQSDIVKVIGPAIKNKLWLQMKADVLNKEIQAIDIPEAVSYGALLAAYKDLKLDNHVYHIHRFLPNVKRTKMFNEIYQKYQTLYNMKILMERNEVC